MEKSGGMYKGNSALTIHLDRFIGCLYLLLEKDDGISVFVSTGQGKKICSDLVKIATPLWF